MTIELVNPNPLVPDFEKIREHFLGPVVPSPDAAWEAANKFIWGSFFHRTLSEPQVPELQEER